MSNPACPKCGKTMRRNPPNREGGKTRWQCRSSEGYCYSTTDPKAGARKQDGSPRRSQKVPIFKRTLGGKSVFLVTSAQNGTPGFKPFIKGLEVAANKLNAEIFAIPLMYKNKHSKHPASQANEPVWADEVQPYLCNQRKRLNKNLVLLGDIKTLPTATSPLTGFEAITHGESGILGHTKLQLRSIPTPQSAMPKLLTTTGVCTERNFTDTKAGALGEFHYTLGACLVEVQGKSFHMRQINASKQDGSFYDLDRFYAPTGGGGFRHETEALVLGDMHVDFLDPAVWAATQDMIRTLRPKKVVLHDLCDGFAINHHTRGNVFNRIAKIKGGRGDARKETERAILFADQLADDFNVEVIVVPSNHNDFLAEWVKNTDPRQDPGNLEFWCDTAKVMAQSAKIGPGGAEFVDPFIYWGRRLSKESRVRYLDRDESAQVCDIELGMHGDVGPNGARGSINNLRRIGVRSIIGHGHSPGINEGCYQVGTSTPLSLEYTRGPSSWLNTHCVIYPNGKRSLLNIIKGQWRLS